jgi:hypothetical protein
LPATLARRIDWLSLRPEPVTFTNELLSRRQSDLLFSARIQGRELLLYVLVEHQSGSEPMMAARVYIYVGRIWEHLLKESSSTSKLPFVLPVVLHQDERGFKAATDVSQLLDLESLDAETFAALSPYLPHCPFLLDDLSGLDDAALKARALTALGALALVLLRDAPFRTPSELLAELEAWETTFFKVLEAPNGVAAVSALLNYAFWVNPATRDQIRAFARRLGPAVEEAFMTGAQQLRQEGKLEGKLEGKVELVLRLLKRRFGLLPENVVTRVREAGPDELDGFADRVLIAEKLDDVLN